MKLRFGLLIIPFLFAIVSVTKAQATMEFDSTDVVLKHFKKHILYLADDKLRGRATGSKGERLAYEYIIKIFNEIGLEKIKDDTDFLLPFDFYNGMVLGMENNLDINNLALKLGEDYYPVGQSVNQSYNGKIIDVGFGIEATTDLNYNDYKKKKSNLKSKAALIDLSNPEPENPHSDYASYNGINYRIEKAIEKGAGAILFYNSNNFAKNPDKEYTLKVNRFDIPVVFLTASGFRKISTQKLKKSVLKLSVQLDEINKTGHNVVGYIDNKADYTVVIGGHYDHLGYGGPGSRYTGKTAIHNGADDNASGTAMVIELARWLKNSQLTNNNYMFVAFSGEEMGLYGSKSLVKYPGFNKKSINYMLNYDMIGRLKDSILNVNGVGTSSNWDVIDSLNIKGIKKVVTTESGMGPSDHVSFYLQNIPAIHFFTGAHQDYHKPSDDEEFINYNGLRAIFDYTIELLSELNNAGKLDFKKTKDNNSAAAPKFTVTLGVMPDYVFSGKGMRIDGVSAGKTAAEAGIQSGDIVIKMGDFNVNDMMSYMEALSKFKKGDRTMVTIKRLEETIQMEVLFK